MGLLQRLFARRNATSIASRQGAGSRRRPRRFSFENLEERRALTAQSFELIGVEAYRDNPAFSQYDGSGTSTTPYSIAILDTGADLDHPDFGDDINPQDGISDRIVYSQNFVNPELEPTAHDDSWTGHGTHVAGIIARMAPGVNLIILKTLAFDQTGNYADQLEALNWIDQYEDDYNIVAVNMSLAEYTNLTTDQTDRPIHNILGVLAAKDIAIVAATGNFYADFSWDDPEDNVEVNLNPGVSYPAADVSAIAVGATWVESIGGLAQQPGGMEHIADDYTQAPDRIAAFSQRHATMLDIFAPGAQITSAANDGATAQARGTSQAAPHVSAAIALAQHLNEVFNPAAGRLDKDELVNLLQATGVVVNDGDDEDDNVHNTELNYKRLDVEAMAYKLFKPAAPNLANTSDWGFSETDDVTADLTPTFTGTTIPGAHVWVYVDGVEKGNAQADGSGNYTVTSSALTAGNRNVTVKIALDSSYVDTARSNPSVALPITIVTNAELDPVTSSFAARLSETLVVDGGNTGTSELLINWGITPQRTLTKNGAGIVTINEVTDPSQTVTYFANQGTTVFTTDTGVSGVPGVSARVANWIVEANANVEFTTTQNLAALSVGASGSVTMAEAGDPPDYNVLYTGSLAFAETAGHATGTLDLTNNGLVIDYATETAARNQLAQVRGWLIDGRGGVGLGNGTWDGTGIISSTAQSRNVTNGESRALGYAMNADLPLGAYSVFLGESVDSSTILVRYTVNGDFNLDGRVNDDDVTIFGPAYGEPGNGHRFLGDADYDGVVHDDDVTIVGGLYDPNYDIDEDPDPNP